MILLGQIPVGFSVEVTDFVSKHVFSVLCITIVRLSLSCLVLMSPRELSNLTVVTKRLSSERRWCEAKLLVYLVDRDPCLI